MGASAGRPEWPPRCTATWAKKERSPPLRPTSIYRPRADKWSACASLPVCVPVVGASFSLSPSLIRRAPSDETKRLMKKSASPFEAKK